jgi:transposase
MLELFRFVHPKQTVAFLTLVNELRKAGIRTQVVLEPTGIYGDIVREQCLKRGAEIFMVQPKHTSDMSEVLDGVPSMHDGKAVHVITRLHTLGMSTPWLPKNPERRHLRALVDERRLYFSMISPVYGQLEALLSKWWPEFEHVLDIYQSKTARSLLMQFGGPSAVAANENEAREWMRRVSKSKLSPEKIEATIEAAKTTLAQEPVEGERELLRAVTREAHVLRERIEAMDKALAPLVGADEAMRRIAKVVGTGTAAALCALVGSPLEFSSAKAFEKALGLNLKTRSSGEHAGRLSITKRGSSHCRQLLYMAALRHIQASAHASAWYRKRRGYKADVKKCAVVAVMRKLVKALWHVARGSEFDPTKLYDARRLELEVVESFDNDRAQNAEQVVMNTTEQTITNTGTKAA